MQQPREPFLWKLLKKNPQVMRSEPPRGISAVEVQVSLMETSQNTIFFLPPILKPTRNYSHTYNQMLQSTTVGERGEGPTASHRLAFLRQRTHRARLLCRRHRRSDSARSRAAVLERYQGCQSRSWPLVSYSKQEAIKPVHSYLWAAPAAKPIQSYPFLAY